MAREPRYKTKKSGRRKSRGPKDGAQQLAIEKRREKVAEMRLSGMHLSEIAKKLKCSIGTVHNDLETVFVRAQESATRSIMQERAVSVGRLDVATKGIWSGVKKGDHEAVGSLTKLEGRRAKLLGLDAPQKQEFDVRLQGALEDLCGAVQPHMSEAAYGELLRALRAAMGLGAVADEAGSDDPEEALQSA